SRTAQRRNINGVNLGIELLDERESHIAVREQGFRVVTYLHPIDLIRIRRKCLGRDSSAFLNETSNKLFILPNQNSELFSFKQVTVCELHAVNDFGSTLWLGHINLG